MKKTPMPHQHKALGDIVPSAKKMKRLTAIMPCGTGKTLVQLWTAEALKPKTVLVLLPSLSLLRQTLHAWMAETKWKKPEVLCVCSDRTVACRSEDEITVSSEDIGYPVTSDSEDIAEFLSRKTNGVKLVFSTYHSSPLVAAGMKKDFAFDLGVFDEAHVTAGKEGGFFSFALKDANLRIKVRTFWTATPRHYDLSKTDGSIVAYSMDDESVYGPVAHKLAFSEAVKQGIICDYEILVPIITNTMIGSDEIEDGTVLIKGKRVPAKIVAHHMALNQAIQRYGVRKIFSFHPRVADAEEFTNGGPQSVVRHIPKGFKVFHVNGGMTTAEREAKVADFRDAKRALMSNARCLTQGIDVPAVDMVAFLSKKRSLIDIVQATGRAMRKAPDKSKGYILVPLYIEQDQGETLEAAVERADFREVWAVLNAMREQDEALTETMLRIRSERTKGKAGGKEAKTPNLEKVTVLGPQVDIGRLRASIITSCVDHLTRAREIYATWQEASKAANALGIKNHREYLKRYPENPRLPASLYESYKGFPGFTIFLRGNSHAKYETWQSAGRAAFALGIRTYMDYRQRHKEDPKLPALPEDFYEDFPGYPTFLGRKVIEKYVTWPQAGKAARKLGIQTQDQYDKLYKKDPRLPSQPASYPGFPGFTMFLGGKAKTFYATWEEASKAAKRLGVETKDQYIAKYKLDPCLPSNPNTKYEDFPGWKEFLAKTPRFYPSWQQAARAVRRLGLSATSYGNGRKQDARLPSDLYRTYRDFPGWSKFLGK